MSQVSPEQLSYAQNLTNRYTALSNNYGLVSAVNTILLLLILTMGILLHNRLFLLGWPVYTIVQGYQFFKFKKDRRSLILEYVSKFPQATNEGEK